MGFFLGTHTSYLFFPIDYLRYFVPILFKIIEDFFFLLKKQKEEIIEVKYIQTFLFPYK